MNSVSVKRLTKTNDESVLKAQSKRMKPMRLRSLQQDPENFISTYEGECDQPEEFWLDRLRPAFVEHWYAVIENGEERSEENLGYNENWVAFLVMLDEDTMNTSLPEFAAGTNENSSVASYKMAALWVDPVVRGQGVGKRMISDSVEYATAQAKARSKQIAHIDLSARKDNVRAIRLYESLGFQVYNPNSVIESEGKTTPAVDMRLKISIQGTEKSCNIVQ